MEWGLGSRFLFGGGVVGPAVDAGSLSVTDRRVPYWLGAPSLAACGLGLFSVCFPDVPGPDCFLFLLT